ncbi:radical SAM protein [Pseudodesulfovibrio sp. JC047]|uniref:elongator complex protein 3 n=1 Tax=Pseudodesulfovibrio sp. JC047 TaxID=2683199 RepID=UPI0013D08790|nr:radical SAM protein [Pseudodesulfovibrio sp. JC047]NDV20654.1 radical SAM protein [Pseudodesulfovibrio sp. JC047]
MTKIRFSHPEPSPVAGRVWPVFLPFAGCPYRCAFCAQDKLTGRDHADLDLVSRELERDLQQALDQGRGPYELAFYGGTFTALPEPWPSKFLALASRFRSRGLLTRIRCSTRPDCVDVPMLVSLKEQGLDMVELGIQSFDDTALQQSSRGYDGQTARRACGIVAESGLVLGVQLLPGLPGDQPGLFASDVEQAAAFAPETARLYPCLVIQGTALATLWEQGKYVPWTLSRARTELASALGVLWARGTRVIRMGLAPEEQMQQSILDGPWHPALGQTVRGMALLDIIRSQVARLDTPLSGVLVPRRYQGELFGHAGELVDAYAAFGVDKTLVQYVNDTMFSVF